MKKDTKEAILIICDDLEKLVNKWREENIDPKHAIATALSCLTALTLDSAPTVDSALSLIKDSIQVGMNKWEDLNELKWEYLFEKL
jgi:hypothetical protein